MPEICDELNAITAPACWARDALGEAAGSAADGLLDRVGSAFAEGAASVLDVVFRSISTTTAVDLRAPYVTHSVAVLVTVALVLVVGLFVVQVTTAAVRREPGGLGRAVVGAGVAVLGAAAAGTVVQALLLVVDEVSNAVAAMAGTSIEEAARRLLDLTALVGLATLGTGGGALMMLFGLLFILGATLILGTLLVREALIVVAVVVAPLAFAGGTARFTSTWVQRWIRVTLALILSKLAIVVVFVVAMGMVGDTTGLGALLSGLILLLLACLAPWATFKVLDFAGTAVAAEWHRATNGSTVSAINQGRMAVNSLMRNVAPIIGGPAGAAAGAAGSGGTGPASGSGGASSGSGSPPTPTVRPPDDPTAGSTGTTGGSPTGGATPGSRPGAPEPRRDDRDRSTGPAWEPPR